MILFDQEDMEDFSSIQSACDSSAHSRVQHGMTKEMLLDQAVVEGFQCGPEGPCLKCPLPNTECSSCNTKTRSDIYCENHGYAEKLLHSKVITVITISHLKVAIVSVIIEVVENAMCFYCSLWHNCQWAVCNVYNHATL